MSLVNLGSSEFPESKPRSHHRHGSVTGSLLLGRANEYEPKTNSIPAGFVTHIKHSKIHRGFNSTANRFSDSEKADQPDPGVYQNSLNRPFGVSEVSSSNSVKGTGSFASKAKRFPTRSTYPSPGPGSHELNNIKDHVPNKSPSYHQPLCPHPTKNTLMPAPSQYSVPRLFEDSHRGHPSVNNASSSFSSKSKRECELPSVRQHFPAPGSYNLASNNDNNNTLNSAPPFSSTAARLGSLGRKDFGPPPGSYDLREDLVVKRSPYSALGSSTYRGFSMKIKHESPNKRDVVKTEELPTPGPGQYELGTHFSEFQIGSSSVFKSTTPRLGGTYKATRGGPDPASYRLTPKLHDKESFIYNPSQRWI